MANKFVAARSGARRVPAVPRNCRPRVFDSRSSRKPVVVHPLAGAPRSPSISLSFCLDRFHAPCVGRRIQDYSMPFASLGLVDDLARRAAGVTPCQPPFNPKRFPVSSWRARPCSPRRSDRYRQDRRLPPAIVAASANPSRNADAGRSAACLVLAPTRGWPLGSPTACASTVATSHRVPALVVGGVSMKPQCDARCGAGWISWWPRQGVCWTTWVEDRQPGRCRDSGAGRADRMLDLGFLPAIRRLLAATAPSGDKPCCSRPPSPIRSASWPAISCTSRR